MSFYDSPNRILNNRNIEYDIRKIFNTSRSGLSECYELELKCYIIVKDFVMFSSMFPLVMWSNVLSDYIF